MVAILIITLKKKVIQTVTIACEFNNIASHCLAIVLFKKSVVLDK